MGNRVGDLLFLLRPRRARIAAANIEACFPELDAYERKDLLRRHLRAVGLGLFETLIAWYGNPVKIIDRFEITGREHIDSRGDSGLILLGIHFTSIELASTLLGYLFPIVGVYRPHDNPLMEYLQVRGRLKGARARAGGSAARLLDRANVREIVRTLREGGLVWIAADQDLGRNRSLFAPFFGVDAATPVAPGKLATAGKAQAASIFFGHVGGGRYRLAIQPPIDGFPSGSDEQDVATFNSVVENLVRERPESYLWVHRRFKTRPPDASPFYSPGSGGK